jgi:hypothetical protein
MISTAPNNPEHVTTYRGRVPMHRRSPNRAKRPLEHRFRVVGADRVGSAIKEFGHTAVEVSADLRNRRLTGSPDDSPKSRVGATCGESVSAAGTPEGESRLIRERPRQSGPAQLASGRTAPRISVAAC